MKLSEYFNKTQGVGILGTADADGKVNMAVYAKPHFTEGDEETVAFIMADRLSHANVAANSHAAYLFMEAGESYSGKRLSLTQVKEETDPEKIRGIQRENLPCGAAEGQKRFLVYFRIDAVRPLIGG